MIMIWSITWDRAGPLGEKGRQLVGKVGEWYVESQHLQGCSPRHQVLNVPIACWWYWLGKLSSWLPTEWLYPHYFNGCLGRETGYGPIDRPASVLWIVSGALFSQEQWLCPSLLMTSQKVATYGECPQEAYTRHMWIGVRNVHVMLVGLSPVGCTSIRITATLGYE
jgi:hypothetical protein